MIGRTLAHYEIVEKLGSGGMGEVYRARDTELRRDVALKVLRREVASDPERLKRFQREARAVAALNHPNVVTIHSVEEADGIPFIVMERVEGTTLRHRIPQGGMPLLELFDLAIPVADALAAAHEKSITHRDLKPDNVMVDAKGRVKVLDFGLAKVGDVSAAGHDANTETAPLTEDGQVMGTVPYMSPEQLKGRPADACSDLFSFGVILYEMAAGHRPFGGESLATKLSAILVDTPQPLTEVRDDIPGDLAHIVEHCLEKEPEDRYRSALDVRNELRRLEQKVRSGETFSATVVMPASDPGAALKRRHRPVWPWAAVTLLVIALASGGWYFVGRAPEEAAAPMEITPLTSDGGWKEHPQLSPDGDKVAYDGGAYNGDDRDIYVKALGVGTRPFRLTKDHPGSDHGPVWSPDGQQIAFFRGLADDSAILYTVPSLGGQERKLAAVKDWELGGTISSPLSLDWSPDGQWLVYTERSSADEPAHIVRLSLTTLERHPLTFPSAGSMGDLFPAVSPDGTLLAYVRMTARNWGNMDVWVQPMTGGEARRLTFKEYTACHSPAWTPEGAILFTVGNGLLNTRVFRVSLEDGEPQPILGVGLGAASPSVRENRLVYVQIRGERPDLLRVPGRGRTAPDRAPEKLFDSSGYDMQPAYSSDGKKVAFESNRSGSFHVWAASRDGSNPVQVTNFEASSGTPHWSPDGGRLAFDSVEAGNQDVYVVDFDGGVPRQLTKEPFEDGTPSWSRDGKWVYFRSDRGGKFDIWKMPAMGGQAVQVTQDGGIYGEESLDGRYLYFSKSSGADIWRVATLGGEETKILSGRTTWQNWAISRQGIYYLLTPQGELVLHYLDFKSGETTVVYRKEGSFTGLGLTVSPDEEWLLFGELQSYESELFLVENFR
jgi:Tol biopolymer transport system component